MAVKGKNGEPVKTKPPKKEKISQEEKIYRQKDWIFAKEGKEEQEAGTARREAARQKRLAAERSSSANNKRDSSIFLNGQKKTSADSIRTAPKPAMKKVAATAPKTAPKKPASSGYSRATDPMLKEIKKRAAKKRY